MAYIRDEIVRSENFVAKQFQVGEFVVVDRNKDYPVLRQQLMQQFQTRIHHAEPLVVAAQILALLAHDLAQPLLDFRVVHVVVVNPLFVARVVRRIDIDALDSPLVFGQQRFQRLQIVAVYDLVAALRLRPVVRVFRPEPILVLQHPIRHIAMMIDNLIFSYPSQYRHIFFLLLPINSFGIT